MTDLPRLAKPLRIGLLLQLRGWTFERLQSSSVRGCGNVRHEVYSPVAAAIADEREAMALDSTDLTLDSAAAITLLCFPWAAVALARATELTDACDAAAPERV